MRIDTVDARAYALPTDKPEADGTLAWSSTTAVVVLVRAEGRTGLGWTYGSSATAAVVSGELAHEIEGADPMDVPRLTEAMARRCRNLGRPGVAAGAVSAVDVALWDLKARLLGVSLVELFGRCRAEVPVYGSGGFTTYDDRTTSLQLEKWVAEWGVRWAKIKIGESWGTAEERDLHRAALAREVLGESIGLFVDANGGYRAKQAIRVGKVLEDDLGVTWFEEPVSSDDLEGLRLVREALALDVAAGEYGYDDRYFARMVVAGSVDCLQADATRCGGYTGWLRAAAIAAASGLEVSAHCAPSLHAHVAASIPNLRHVEHFHDHDRLDRILFEGALVPGGGSLHPDCSAPGHGMALRDADADPYRLT